MCFIGIKPLGARVENALDAEAPKAFQGAFPYNGLTPAPCRELLLVPTVDLTVAFDLRTPELRACRRPFEKGTVVPVPETPVGEDHGSPTREYEVGLAWKLAVMDAEAQAFCVEAFPQDQFRARVRPANPSHHAAADLGRNDVRHILLATK